MELKQNSSSHNIQMLQKAKTTKIQFGKYILHYPPDHPKKKPIHKEVMKELKDEDKDILDLSWGKYKRFKWDKVFKYIKETFISKVSAYGNTDNKMLLSLSQVTFHNLTYLDLRDCQLENIEALPSGPNLNYLSLANNNIYSVSSLNKCELTGLKTLLLNDNPISILGLDRCNFRLETFWLERKYNTTTINQSLCQTSIFKLKSQQMKDISIQSQKRIYQPRPKKRIREKYLHLERLLYVDPDFVDDDQIEFINYLSDSEEQMIPLEEDDDMELSPLHSMEGEDDEEWIQELQGDICEDSQFQQFLQQQREPMSDESWGSEVFQR